MVVRTDWIEKWLKWSERIEAPDGFKLWAGIFTLSASMGRRCWIDVFAPLFPSQYVIFVGPGGIRKSTMINHANKVTTGVYKLPSSSTREAMFEDMEKHMYKADKYPIMPDSQGCKYVSDSVLFCSEWANTLGSKKDNNRFISSLNELWDCLPEFKHSTKTNGKTELEATCLNMIGGITPIQLDDCLNTSNLHGGFFSRCLMVYATVCETRAPEWHETPEETRLREEFTNELANVRNMNGEFRYDETWRKKWLAFRNDDYDTPAIADHRFGDYLNRRPAHMLKICMAYAASEGDGMLLTGRTFDRAHEALVNVEQKLPRVFLGFGRNPLARIMPDVMNTIEKHTRMHSGVYIRDLLREFSSDLSLRDMKELTDTFKEQGWIIMGEKDGKKWVKSG